jgi:hypothetical protein
VFVLGGVGLGLELEHAEASGGKRVLCAEP